MRVLFVTCYYWPATEWGGPAYSVPLLASGLAKIGLDVEAVTTTTRGTSGLAALTPGVRDVDGVRVWYCRAFGARRHFFAPRMLSIMKDRLREFDVVHVQGAWPVPALAAALACACHKRPFIVSTRGTLDPWSLAQKTLKKKTYMTLAGKHVLRAAAAIHFTADGERMVAPPEIQALPYYVVPNALDTDRFAHIPPPKPSTGRLRLLMVGRIHRKKGFDLLIPALALALRRGLTADLTIVGPDEDRYRTEVERMVVQHGLSSRVRFVGHLGRTDLVAELALADLVVLPSYQENFAMSAAEAMAAARPVLVSEQVNIAADVLAHGAGYVVPLQPHAIADAIIHANTDCSGLEAMGCRGRHWVTDAFGLLSVARRMRDVYAEVCEKFISSSPANARH